MEQNFCKKCGKCCEKIAVDFNTNIMYRDGIEPLTEKFKQLLTPVFSRENITFCTCRFYKNNLCSNPEKPAECLKFPSSPFAYLPEDCGYEGEIFIKNEHIKQKIRKLKEEIIEYETRLNHEPELKRIIDHHKNFIYKYKTYGAADW